MWHELLLMKDYVSELPMQIAILPGIIINFFAWKISSP
jgi:hypothetical protein